MRYASVGFLYHAASRQVLLHHRDARASLYPECWAGFGGRDEPQDGGDPSATWRREMREELGVELSPEVIDSPQSLITAQVESGLVVRMAILYELLAGSDRARPERGQAPADTPTIGQPA